MARGTFAQVAMWDIPGSYLCLKHFPIILYLFTDQNEINVLRSRGGAVAITDHGPKWLWWVLCKQRAVAHPRVQAAGQTVLMPGLNCEEGIEVRSKVRVWKSSFHLFTCPLPSKISLVPFFLPSFTLSPWGLLLGFQSIVRDLFLCTEFLGPPLVQNWGPSSFHLLITIMSHIKNFYEWKFFC